MEHQKDSKESFLKERASSNKGLLAKYVFFFCAILSIVITGAIIFVLLSDAIVFFSHISPIAFFTGTQWNPLIKPEHYGVLPLITGTLTITLGAAIIAVPTGVLTAIFLSEYASDGFRSIVKPALEILAGIPTIVYGYFALVYLTPLLSGVLPTIRTFNALSGSIVVGIMIIPMVSSITEDAMNAVPNSLREGGYALGATKFKVSTTIVVPAALSGIISSFILAISRAIGETMAVTIAAGKYPRMVNLLKPDEAFLKPVETMTAAMVEIGMSDVSGQTIAYKSLFAIGLTLFGITFLMNLISNFIKSRYREEYE
ncbi:MAG: phosphate ABC transporter permease subunit PstC [Candidatus Bipolaricaulota bacterium]|nr:phosphate ABC transporter permease subunit PstC [Candidatus Bipolaricaulota bacterium]MBS3792510.1 phosphate ABC transporter permease subunit PstC [Candidatus Bipolaricaulota bacterium]